MGVAIAKQSIDLGIVTTNGDAMLAFYRDVLGLRYVEPMPMPGGVTMHRMLCGDSLVKLLVAPKVAAPAAPGGIPGANGYRYWTITVSNLKEMVEACGKAGAKVIIADKEVRPGVRIAMVADPDGNWVEFLQNA
jgi:catechol 2,3-dioxygenase-like lactoylglutathione lyase family enzyme